MKKKHILKSNLYQVLLSPEFILSILAIIFLSYVGIWEKYDLAMFSNALIDNMEILIGFKKILAVIAAFTFSTSFCTDWNNQFIRPYIIRSGVNRYILAKLITCYATAFGVTFWGLLLFVLINLPFQSIISPEVTQLMPPFDTIGAFSPFLYLVVKLFIFSLGNAFWVLCGFTLSAYIPNRFVAVISPLIFCYFFEELKFLPKWINFYALTRVSDVIDQDAFFSFLYYLFIFLVLSGMMGLLFARQVKRRVQNEVV